MKDFILISISFLAGWIFSPFVKISLPFNLGKIYGYASGLQFAIRMRILKSKGNKK